MYKIYRSPETPVCRDSRLCKVFAKCRPSQTPLLKWGKPYIISSLSVWENGFAYCTITFFVNSAVSDII